MRGLADMLLAWCRKRRQTASTNLCIARLKLVLFGLVNFGLFGRSNYYSLRNVPQFSTGVESLLGCQCQILLVLVHLRSPFFAS